MLMYSVWEQSPYFIPKFWCEYQNMNINETRNFPNGSPSLLLLSKRAIEKPVTLEPDVNKTTQKINLQVKLLIGQQTLSVIKSIIQRRGRIVPSTGPAARFEWDFDVSRGFETRQSRGWRACLRSQWISPSPGTRVVSSVLVPGGLLTLARPHYRPLIGLYHLYRSQAN